MHGQVLQRALYLRRVVSQILSLSHIPRKINYVTVPFPLTNSDFCQKIPNVDYFTLKRIPKVLNVFLGPILIQLLFALNQLFQDAHVETHFASIFSFKLKFVLFFCICWYLEVADCARHVYHVYLLIVLHYAICMPQCLVSVPERWVHGLSKGVSQPISLSCNGSSPVLKFLGWVESISFNSHDICR